MDDSEDFAELLFSEVVKDGLECSAVEMLCDIAKTGDWDTAASAIGYFGSEMGRPDLAANLIRRLMKAPDGAAQPDYLAGAQVLGKMIESGALAAAKEIAQYLLVARVDGSGHKSLDCFDLCMVVGHMVGQAKAPLAGKLLFAFYSDDSEEGGPASQSLVPFMLGTLVDYRNTPWAVEVAKQLLYADLDEGDDPESGYDYSVLGWCLAQMVWAGRADVAACLCLELKRQRLAWYDDAAMMEAVAGWGDVSYSQTIQNHMRAMDNGGGR